mmetsp:Transcript_19362/g.62187  ORF Transcript_19362/g.62187 Transcript_19362/m.62187 type:complete len:311 (-) Transcript_19362:1633-2565(-)
MVEGDGGVFGVGGGDDGVVGGDVGVEVLLAVGEEGVCGLPSSEPAAGGDGRGEGLEVGVFAGPPQFVEELDGLLVLARPLAGADDGVQRRAVGGHGGLHQLDGLLPPARLGRRRHQGARQDRVVVVVFGSYELRLRVLEDSKGLVVGDPLGDGGDNFRVGPGRRPDPAVPGIPQKLRRLGGELVRRLAPARGKRISRRRRRRRAARRRRRRRRAFRRPADVEEGLVGGEGAVEAGPRSEFVEEGGGFTEIAGARAGGDHGDVGRGFVAEAAEDAGFVEEGHDLVRGRSFLVAGVGEDAVGLPEWRRAFSL